MRLLRHKRGNPDTGLCRSLRHRATSRLYSTFLREWVPFCPFSPLEEVSLWLVVV